MAKYEFIIHLIEYGSNFFKNPNYKSKFIKEMEETKPYKNTKYFEEREELLKYLKKKYNITVKLKYPEGQEWKD